jgi:hypothetical protein
MSNKLTFDKVEQARKLAIDSMVCTCDKGSCLKHGIFKINERQSEKEFLKYLLKYIPVRCRADKGCDYNLKDVRFMIEERLK